MSGTTSPQAVPPTLSQTAFASFRRTFPALQSRLAPRNSGELVQMTVVDGLKFINAPQPERHAAAVPTNAEDAKTHRHL